MRKTLATTPVLFPDIATGLENPWITAAGMTQGEAISPNSGTILVKAPTLARSPRYKDVSEEKADGATYTPEILANFVAGQIAAQMASVRGRARLRVLDPAVGEAVLIVSLLNQLKSRGIEDVDVYGFDTDEKALKTAGERLRLLFPHAKVKFASENFLDFVDRTADPDNLFSFAAPVKFDLIIANPPYVRTQVLGAGIAQKIARQYGLAGRVDLYYAFILAMGWVLAEQGTAGIIVSNRFMTTKSGTSVRRAILETFHVKHIWDLGDTKLFDAAVLPAVLLLNQRATDSPRFTTPPFTTIYETDDTPSAHAHDPIDALRHAGTVSVQDGRRFRVQHGKLNPEAHKNDVWRVATDGSDAWGATVQAHTWASFSEIGKIRVGIKTCADEVFIRSNWTTPPEEQRPELLLPLTTHHIARRFKADSLHRSRQVLYPHTVIDGQRQAVDLDLYPKSKAYLETHRRTLTARTYVTEAGRQWYEIWVPQDPNAWAEPKLVFRDISEQPTFWIDQDGTIVNGDCYWLTARSKKQAELLWLALAVSNSTFIEAFYDHSFNNKLYAGRRRFITQYVERFPLPDPSTALAHKIIELSKKIYELTPSPEARPFEDQLDVLIWKAFGLSVEKVGR
jgi:adenine-specific DNA-methyltransferase